MLIFLLYCVMCCVSDNNTAVLIVGLDIKLCNVLLVKWEPEQYRFVLFVNVTFFRPGTGTVALSVGCGYYVV